MCFPDGKRFAFSILDDTDDATLENVRPVYDKLRECGMVTTKSAWPLECPEGSEAFFAAETLQTKAYRDFVHELVDGGYELAFHGATMESSRRERTLAGIEFLEKEFGFCPRLHCNHGLNRENMYWGHHRYHTHVFRSLAAALGRARAGYYGGHERSSEYFWGDVCKARFAYVRNFAFGRLNMLEVNPEMPYARESTPYVNRWFSTADAPDAEAFNRLLAFPRIDRLQSDGGVCIVSTHFGKRFVAGGRLNQKTAEILQYIARAPAWIAPVSDILDRMKECRQASPMSFVRRFRLDLMFVIDRLRMHS